MWVWMWINILLVLSLDTPLYWYTVIGLQEQGCRVYNVVYVSCPTADPPPGAVFVPADAFPVYIPRGGRAR